MSKHLLRDFMPTDKEAVFERLSISLEQIWKMDAEERARTEIVNDLTELGLKVRRDFPGDIPLLEAIANTLKIASVGTDTNIASMEGLGDIFGKLFGRSKKPSVKDIDPDNKNWNEKRKAIKAFVEEMKKTYLNDAWLNKQKLVTEPVPAKDIGKYLEIDGKPVTDPMQNVELVKARVDKFIKSWSSQYLKTSSAVKHIHERLVKATSGAVVGDAASLKLVEKAIQDFESIPDPTRHFPNFDGTSFGNIIPYVNGEEVDTKTGIEPKGTDSIPALDREGIKAMCDIIVDIMSRKYFSRPDMGWWLDFETGEKFTDWLQESDEDLLDRYYGKFYIDKAGERYVYVCYSLVDEEKLVSSLIRLIDRSIK